MKTKLKLTTVALEDDQHLIAKYHSSIVETYCIGYTGSKRDRTLDGHYFSKELSVKKNRIADYTYGDNNQFIS